MPMEKRRDVPTKKVTFILPVELVERFQAAGNERNLSMTFMVEKAIEDLLENVLPPNEIKITRPKLEPEPEPESGRCLCGHRMLNHRAVPFHSGTRRSHCLMEECTCLEYDHRES